MNSPLTLIPPDDTGTDTLKRYRYQAQLALPFCLECARRDRVRSVIMEHFEDIVVEYENHWQFIQVKTRDARRGPWKLADTIHALKSLCRTFRATSHLNVKYSLFLEGAIDSKQDNLNALVQPKTHISETLIKRVAKALGIAEPECMTFLNRVTVHPNQTNRADVTATNIRLMGQLSGNTSAKELGALEQRLTDEIFRAMSCDRLEDLLHKYIAKANALQNEERDRVNTKRLIAENIIPILGSLITGDYPLLRRITDLDTPAPTNLEKKLIAGGATERIISDAKVLRANASFRETEILASGFLNEDNEIIDVHTRLEILTNSIVESHEEIDKPARIIWREVLNALNQNAAQVDPNRIYKQDPWLLLGAACGLSDECRIDWGVKLA